MLNAIISTSTKILQSETKFYKPRGYCNSAVSFSIANTSFLFAYLYLLHKTLFRISYNCKQNVINTYGVHSPRLVSAV